MFFLSSLILGVFEWVFSYQIDCFLQGLVGACGITVLCNLMRVHFFLQTCSDCDDESERKQRSSSADRSLVEQWSTSFQFWCLTILLSLVGPRVASFIVLEYSLRAASSWITVTVGKDSSSRGLLMQCQFSLGCALTVTLSVFQQGAVYSSLNLLLAAGLSWALASISHNLWKHVEKLYPLHSMERYCGKCITLLTSGHTMLARLQRGVVLAFAIAVIASTATVYDHFLSQNDALKFWTPLTLCYTMLVTYIQEEQNRQAGPEVLLRSVVLRLGALMVLMLTVGHWSDVLHILITFLGEAVCLLPSQDLMKALSKEEEDDIVLRKQNRVSTSRHTTKENTPSKPSDSPKTWT